MQLLILPKRQPPCLDQELITQAATPAIWPPALIIELIITIMVYKFPFPRLPIDDR